MICELSVLPGKGVVLSSSSGPITVEDRVRHRKNTLRFCKEKSINKILLDMRGQISLSDTMENFHYGTTMPEMTRGFQIAFLCDCGDTDSRFIGTVAANRGAHIRSFDSFDQAREWLEPANKRPEIEVDACSE